MVYGTGYDYMDERDAGFFTCSFAPFLESAAAAASASEGTSTSNIAEVEVGESSRSLPEPGGGSAVVRLPTPGGTPPSPSVDPRAVSALGELPLASHFPLVPPGMSLAEYQSYCYQFFSRGGFGPE